MFNDTVNAKCECIENSECLQENCDCNSFCCIYIDQVKEWDSCQAFTISPNPLQYESIEKMDADWQDNFRKLNKKCHDLLVVMEKANKVHYHGIANISDKIGFNALLFSLSRYHNVKQHNIFKNKLHYLFKDVYKTYQATGICPVHESLDYKAMDDLKKEKTMLQRISHKMNNLDEPVLPQWMKGDLWSPNVSNF